MKTKTTTSTKTTKTAAKPAAAVKSIKTVKGHTLAAVKDGKLVKIAECVREDATAAKPKPEAVKAKPKAEAKPAPAPSAPSVAALPTFPKWEREATTHEELERRIAAINARRPKIEHFDAPKAGYIRIAMSDSYCRPADYKGVLAAFREISTETDNYLTKHFRDAAAWAVKAANCDEELALMILDISYHNDRGDGRLYVPGFRRGKYLSDWIDGAADSGVKNSIVRAA